MYQLTAGFSYFIYVNDNKKRKEQLNDRYREEISAVTYRVFPINTSGRFSRRSYREQQVRFCEAQNFTGKQEWRLHEQVHVAI